MPELPTVTTVSAETLPLLSVYLRVKVIVLAPKLLIENPATES